MKLTELFLPRKLPEEAEQRIKSATKERPNIFTSGQSDYAWLTKNGDRGMIEVTRLNDEKVVLNSDLIETVEETPNTVITLTTGRKIIVKESRQEVRNRVILYKKECYVDLCRLILSESGK